MPFPNQTDTVRYRHPEWPEEYWLDFKAHMTQGDMEAITKKLYSYTLDAKTNQVSIVAAGHSAARLIFMQMLRGMAPDLRRDAGQIIDISSDADYHPGAFYDVFPVSTAEHLNTWLNDLYTPQDTPQDAPASTRRKRKPTTRVDALEF